MPVVTGTDAPEGAAVDISVVPEVVDVVEELAPLEVEVVVETASWARALPLCQPRQNKTPAVNSKLREAFNSLISLPLTEVTE